VAIEVRPRTRCDANKSVTVDEEAWQCSASTLFAFLYSNYSEDRIVHLVVVLNGPSPLQAHCYPINSNNRTIMHTDTDLYQG
ncbi:hypothetical protein PIB30_102795, partial [Stylosanthes scabra]|nr:hypothetical protein [Stylosanthes scabra]